MSGISAGNFVRNTGKRLTLPVGPFLRGRVINALGQPIDGLVLPVRLMVSADRICGISSRNIAILSLTALR